MLLSFFLVLWLLCPIIASVMAADKGRGGCAWFVLGLFFGPITVLAAAAMSPDYRVLDMRAKEKRLRSIENKELLSKAMSVIFGQEPRVIQEPRDSHLGIPKELDDKIKKYLLIFTSVLIVLFIIFTYKN